MMPVRIQRRRTAGWRMPPNAIYVGRPSKLGNPFVAADPATAVEAFRRWITSDDSFWTAGNDDGLTLAFDPGMRRLELRRQLAALAGFDLACWCPLGRPCHADVLLEIANEDAP